MGVDQAGQHHLIEPGGTFFIRVDMAGDLVAVSIVKQAENEAVIVRASVADILALPAPVVPLDPPKKPVDPPKEPTVTDQQNPLPAFIASLLPAWLAKYPVPQIRPGEGDDEFTERMRNWMLPLHEQIEFLAPGQGYGRKRGDPGRPWGKDTIPHVMALGEQWDGHAIVEGEGWDLFLGTSTGHPSFNPNVRSVNLSGQYFETVAPVDHMGNGKPVDPPDPPKDGPTAFPAFGSEIVDKMVAKFAGYSTGSDDQKRQLTEAIAVQLAFSVDPKYGAKRAAPGRDKSKNAIAYHVDPLVGFVLFTDTGGIIANPAPQSMAGQVFEPVAPADILGLAKPPGGSGGGDTGDLTARLAALEQRVTGISNTTGASIASLKARVGRLEKKARVARMA